MNQYATRCSEGHVWGIGDTKSEAKEEAQGHASTKSYSVKLLPAVEITESAARMVGCKGGNLRDMLDMVLVDNVLTLDTEQEG